MYRYRLLGFRVVVAESDELNQLLTVFRRFGWIKSVRYDLTQGVLEVRFWRALKLTEKLPFHAGLEPTRLLAKYFLAETALEPRVCDQQHPISAIVLQPALERLVRIRMGWFEWTKRIPHILVLDVKGQETVLA